MSHIHFPSTQKYADRIIQMGEHPDNVFCYGAPGLDNVNRLNLLERAEIFKIFLLPHDKKLGIVTFHPVTLEENTAEAQIDELLLALKKFTDIFWIFTMPNADTGGRVIMQRIKNFLSNNPETGKAFTSLGQFNYLSLLKHADVMVGNSSSGLIEAPSFELPVINIGDRQKGRIKAENVIDVPICEKSRIIRAIRKAISRDFIDSLKGLKNPYGEGNVSEKIVEVLRTVPLSEISKKLFCELNVVRG
jgi:UDP-hydrolysing UDP-N-acetyl-D-glucosamine 2-epimerase